MTFPYDGGGNGYNSVGGGGYTGVIWAYTLLLSHVQRRREEMARRLLYCLT